MPEPNLLHVMADERDIDLCELQFIPTFWEKFMMDLTQQKNRKTLLVLKEYNTHTP